MEWSLSIRLVLHSVIAQTLDSLIIEATILRLTIARTKVGCNLEHRISLIIMALRLRLPYSNPQVADYTKVGHIFVLRQFNHCDSKTKVGRNLALRSSFSIKVTHSLSLRLFNHFCGETKGGHIMALSLPISTKVSRILAIKQLNHCGSETKVGCSMAFSDNLVLRLVVVWPLSLIIMEMRLMSVIAQPLGCIQVLTQARTYNISISSRNILDYNTSSVN